MKNGRRHKRVIQFCVSPLRLQILVAAAVSHFGRSAAETASKNTTRGRIESALVAFSPKISHRARRWRWRACVVSCFCCCPTMMVVGTDMASPTHRTRQTFSVPSPAGAGCKAPGRPGRASEWAQPSSSTDWHLQAVLDSDVFSVRGPGRTASGIGHSHGDITELELREFGTWI